MNTPPISYQGWTYVATIPIGQLPLFSVGLTHYGGHCFCAPWITEGLRITGTTVVNSTEKPQLISPCARGDLNYYNIQEGYKGVALSEKFQCGGTPFCTPPLPSPLSTKKSKHKCLKRWRWAICGDNPHVVHIFECGTHGEEYKVDLSAMRFPLHLLRSSMTWTDSVIMVQGDGLLQ